MKTNIGSTDRTIRALLGIVLVLIGNTYNIWITLFAVVILMTALFSWCPVYIPFGWNTKNKSEKSY